MHKRIAYSLLILFLFANTEAHELLKIPYLVQHFVSHTSSGQSLGDFLSEHYGKASKGSDDEHRKLPFKTHHSVSGLLVAELHQLPFVVTEQALPVYGTSASFRAEDQFLPNYLNSIWQPPKNA